MNVEVHRVELAMMSEAARPRHISAVSVSRHRSTSVIAAIVH